MDRELSSALPAASPAPVRLITNTASAFTIERTRSSQPQASPVIVQRSSSSTSTLPSSVSSLLAQRRVDVSNGSSPSRVGSSRPTSKAASPNPKPTAVRPTQTARATTNTIPRTPIQTRAGGGGHTASEIAGAGLFATRFATSSSTPSTRNASGSPGRVPPGWSMVYPRATPRPSVPRVDPLLSPLSSSELAAFRSGGLKRTPVNGGSWANEAQERGERLQEAQARLDRLVRERRDEATRALTFDAVVEPEAPKKTIGGTPAATRPAKAVDPLPTKTSSPTTPSLTANVPRSHLHVEHVDVVVIGAGLAGLSAAMHLARLAPARRIAVVDSASRVGGRPRTRTVRVPGLDAREHEVLLEFGATRGSNSRVDATLLDLARKWSIPLSSCTSATPTSLGVSIVDIGGGVVRVHEADQSLFEVGGALSRRESRLLTRALAPLDKVARDLATSNTNTPPQHHPAARDLDAQTVWSWSRAQLGGCDSTTARVIEHAARTLFGVEPSELSLLSLVTRAAACQCTVSQLVSKLFGTDPESAHGGGEEEELKDLFLDARSQTTLAERMALALGRDPEFKHVSLHLDTDIARVREARVGGARGEVRHSPSALEVWSTNGQTLFTAHHVLLALAPSSAACISFEPRLSVAREVRLKRSFTGARVDIRIVYARAWWRACGLNGVGVCLNAGSSSDDDDNANSPISRCEEILPPRSTAGSDNGDSENAPVVLGVELSGRAAVEWSSRSARERRTAVLAHLARWFCRPRAPFATKADVPDSSEVEAPLAFEELDWTQGGGGGLEAGRLVSLLPPGVLSAYSDEATHTSPSTKSATPPPTLASRIHLASASSYFHDDQLRHATRAARRAAEEVHARLDGTRRDSTNGAEVKKSSSSSSSSVQSRTIASRSLHKKRGGSKWVSLFRAFFATILLALFVFFVLLSSSQRETVVHTLEPLVERVSVELASIDAAVRPTITKVVNQAAELSTRLAHTVRDAAVNASDALLPIVMGANATTQ